METAAILDLKKCQASKFCTPSENFHFGDIPTENNRQKSPYSKATLCGNSCIVADTNLLWS